jgi:hypothetical protein
MPPHLATTVEHAMELRQDATVLGNPLGALRGVLRAQGVDVADFEFVEHESGLAGLRGGAGGILSVRQRSTGEERLYATGADSAWLGAFMMDVASGHFGTVGRQTA